MYMYTMQVIFRSNQGGSVSEKVVVADEEEKYTLTEWILSDNSKDLKAGVYFHKRHLYLRKEPYISAKVNNHSAKSHIFSDRVDSQRSQSLKLVCVFVQNGEGP